MPDRIRLVGGIAHGRHVSRADAARAKDADVIRVTILDGWFALIDLNPVFRRDPELAGRCAWTTYRRAGNGTGGGVAEYHVAHPPSGPPPGADDASGKPS